MKKIVTILILTFAFTFFGNIDAHAQKVRGQGGIVFKIPKNVFPMDWKKNDFKGLLMLEKDSPSGVFITYPNDDESIEAVKKRAAKFIFPMFSSGAKDKEYGKDESKWQVKDIPSHKGDKNEFAKYYFIENDLQMTQILFYEREAGGKTFIYGYFSNRNKKDKINKKKWADDEGKGAKLLKKFWKTLSD